MKLFSDRRAAHHLASFEHKPFQSRLGQVAGSDQPVMPSANNDNVVRCRHSADSVRAASPFDVRNGYAFPESDPSKPEAMPRPNKRRRSLQEKYWLAGKA